MTSNEFLFAGLFIQVLNMTGFQYLAYCQGTAAELCEVILRWNWYQLKAEKIQQ